METVLTTSPAEAAEFIKNGGICAFPTETVYGLGADIFDEAAIGKIFTAKSRPSDNPLIAHIGDPDQIAVLTAEVPDIARILIEAFFPGPLTIVLPKKDEIPQLASAGLDTIGIRMPRNRTAIEFLSHCGVPLVAPSANLSGKPSPTTWQAVYEDLSGRIDCILQGEVTEFGLESTVVDCSGDSPLVLRTGALSIEEIQNVLPSIRIYEVSGTEKPRSPGLRHKHYSPEAKVFLVSNEEEFLVSEGRNAFIGLKMPERGFELTKICDSTENYARFVFDFFRECDRQGIGNIYCERVNETGIGIALMDRLKRASES
ncbi:MAG: L-threonylcarbamoyladenylate synthase [Pyrinomonadaceae bacterium]